MGPEDSNYPREAQFAENGKRFGAAEGLDFNSLYACVLRLYYRLFN